MADEEEVVTETDEETEGGESAQDGDGLGDKGREALAKERKARREAAKELKALKAELDALKAQGASATEQDEAKKAVEQARREAEAAANEKANKRVVAADVRAAATGKLADPADALAFLDLTQFEVGEDGSTDKQEIDEAISDLLKRKPHLAAKASGFEGSDSGGGSASRRQLTREQLKTMTAAQINKAREEGRLDKLLSAG